MSQSDNVGISSDDTIDSLLRQEERELREEDEAEERLIALVTGQNEADEDEDDDDDEAEVVRHVRHISLADIPLEHWGDLQVSPASKMRDVVWHLKSGNKVEGSKDINWLGASLGQVFMNEGCENLLRLIRGLAFYALPQNDIFYTIRTYGSSASHIRSGLVNLAVMFYQQGIYVDRHGNGAFRDVHDLPEQTFKDFADNLSQTMRLGFIRSVRRWYKLSQAGLLPPQYQLSYEVFSAKDLKEEFKAARKQSNPWQPIPLTALSSIVQHCLEIIENGADDIVRAYELLWPALAVGPAGETEDFDWDTALRKLEQIESSAWNMEEFVAISPKVGGESELHLLRRTILSHPSRDPVTHRYTNLSTLSRRELVETAVSLGIDIKELSRAIYYDLARIRRYFVYLTTTVRYACIVLILAVTGMRRSELLNLKSGCADTVDDYGQHRIKVTVFKTSDGSSGDEVDLPIPETTYKAIQTIEKLGAIAREKAQCDYLFVNMTINFGTPASYSYLHRALRGLCEDAGLDVSIHPHQFRKTLAMYIIYQDAANLPLIKRLFSHKSYRMTLAYVTKLPGLAKEVKLELLRQNRELFGEAVTAVRDGKVGGRAGQQIKESLTKGRYAAMLSEDGFRTMEEYVDTLIDEGVTLLHRAALSVICIKTPAVDTPAPCDAPNADKVRRLHPNVQNCDPLDCPFAVFTEKSVPKLLNEIKFHREQLAHPYVKDKQRAFSEREIKRCTARLVELGVTVVDDTAAPNPAPTAGARSA